MNDYFEGLIERIKNAFGIETKEEEYKPQDPYLDRKKYLKHTTIFWAILAIILIVPICMTKKEQYNIPTQFYNNTSVTQSATIKKVKSTYNPDSKLLISEFFIGNQNDIDDAKDDRNLANIKYSIEYSIGDEIRHNKKTKYPTRIMRVNDHYLVIITQGVDAGYGLLAYKITPEKIKRAINTDCANTEVTFYLKEEQVAKNTNLRINNDSYYVEDYKKFALKNYQQKLTNLNKKIKEKKNVIEDDSKLLAKLNGKMENALKQNKSELQDQIDDTENDIAEQKKEISDCKKEINDYQNRINHVTIMN
ncbi:MULTISPECIES: hypothetical protein [unclassified Lactobacillus]|uniref:coiled-coil domain-containing protein n=1 Tax=unclassified Lactobacillus TaxID=2620435 RepID=UPI000EFD5329|nr:MULTISPECIES: hypothetical protein [unclassified Lactobacillus]RMC38112.1 hypothetical protein F5ESL0237_07695 [Lactobacillus sp. ESL0237]RMC42635.1 hypothetical protein F5ESL0234_07550 [Lactobacillus sp. ESL0234]RMC43340.1 hypothetical protein F5ESL0236_07720 [Lactobacillus sp. ESL0236]RMC47847.1 hypothetical protein F5ESL0225_07900 [Lactobacillus sp. ESL0225]